MIKNEQIVQMIKNDIDARIWYVKHEVITPDSFVSYYDGFLDSLWITSNITTEQRNNFKAFIKSMLKALEYDDGDEYERL